jgi:sugar lactone lactonase YvrE
MSPVPLSPDLTPRVVLAAQAQLAEGALWNPLDQCLYWVDIEGCGLHIFDPATGHDRQLPTGARIGTVVPTTHPHEVLVALQTGIHRLNTSTGDMTLLSNPLTDPHLRFNDGKCDPAGRFWVGTLDTKGRKRQAVLYRYDPDGRLHPMIQAVDLSNGIVWSLDGRTMYYIDTPTCVVQAFDYDPATGGIANNRVAVQIPPGNGVPDGMTIDAEGQLWVALWGAGRVARFDPATGQQTGFIAVPAPHTSSCAFGGPELKTLFITTARHELTPEQLQQYPLSGNLFAVEPGVAGVPAHCFRSGFL